MVCKECGSYNAENLSVCKVCGAKLRDDDTGANNSDMESGAEDGRPARDFVKPPAWPKSAYSGAPETPVRSSSSDASAPMGSFRPTIPPRAAAPTATCPHCGKPVISDAPFCAYCGQRIAGEPAPAASPARGTPQQSHAAYSAEDFDDEDEYDEEEEDYKPAKPSKHAGKIARRNEAEDLDEYDDEEYDDEEYDEAPRKRGKGTTILFWGLIVLLLALIVVFGMYIAKKNFGGSVSKMFASIGTIFNKNGSEDVNADNPEATADPEAQMYTASISEYTDPTTSVVSYDIDIAAPTGDTIRIITDATLKNDTVKVAANNHIVVRIAREVFMPNEPVESETLTIQPNIQAVSPEGNPTQIAVPEITVVVPALSMTVTEPATDTVQATYKNDPINIIGQVNNFDSNIHVFVNDEQVFVDSTGLFTASYTPKSSPQEEPSAAPAASTDPSATPNPSTSPDAAASPDLSASPDAAATEEPLVADNSASGGTETITIEARKNNCVTARKVITVNPYVKQTMSFTVTNDLAGLSSAEGSVTITGTATPGAVVSATCTSADVTFGQATVSETGTFSMVVSIAKVGAYDVSLVGELEGYFKGTANVTVERPPSASSSTFKKSAADITKSFDKITSGAVTSGDFVVTGRVTEIIATEPFTIFRVHVSEGVEVIVANRSAKSTINSSDLKEKKQVAGTLKGLYSDGTTPYLWGWFIWNK